MTTLPKWKIRQIFSNLSIKTTGIVIAKILRCFGYLIEGDLGGIPETS